MRTYPIQLALAAALLAVTGHGRAQADLLHAYAEANALSQGVGGFGEFAKQADTTQTRTGMFGAGIGSASASSSGGSNASNISLGGYSQVQTVGYSLTSWNSFTHSIWRDTISVVGGQNLNQIILTFDIHVSMTLSPSDHFPALSSGVAFGNVDVAVDSSTDFQANPVVGFIHADRTHNYDRDADYPLTQGWEIRGNANLTFRNKWISDSTKEFDGRISAPISLREGEGVFAFKLDTEAIIAWEGSAAVDSSHTMTLASALLPDGTTPESHGFSLSFGSGSPSPNVQAVVPEPSSLVLVALGLPGAGVVVARRRRATTEHARS